MRLRDFILCSLLAAPCSLVAQQKVDFRRSASPTVSVRLGGAFTTIRIIGWDRDSVDLTGSLSANSKMDGGAMAGPGPTTGMKFWIDAPDQASAKNNRLELRVPRNARVWIKSGSADIDASDVTGGLDLNIVGGSVKVSGKPRELIVESMDGKVTCVGAPEYAKLKTATGDITLQGGGEDITLTTVSGTINASDGTIQRGRFESVTGVINFGANLARGGEARFDTHSGNVELRFDRSAGVEVDAASVTGSIENLYSKTRAVAGREGRGMELGVPGAAGGPHVTVRTFKGNVRLTSR
jgi:hypothetical protein